MEMEILEDPLFFFLTFLFSHEKPGKIGAVEGKVRMNTL